MNTKEQLIEKLKNWIIETNVINYDKEIGLDCDDKRLVKLRGSEIKKEAYVISFKTEDNLTYDKNGEIDMFIEGMYCFAYFDAITLDLLYILKKAGYIEIDGSY